MIVRPLVVDGSAGPMRPDQAVLVSYKDNDWLVTEDGRHGIDLADRAVTSAVGIPVTAKATPISEGLFNALPNARAVAAARRTRAPARPIPLACRRIW